MVNTNKIKGRIIELGLSNKKVAEALEIAVSTVSQKINNVRPMSLEEAERLANLLKISGNDFTKYFFTDYVA